ncbi:hypothetical protein [Vibrio japonicus]|uniref:Uncharacterized protein n=1 Tax=Vibrio japonicus TaxID=1824638 RepID=A0ABY5LNW0_9VIBR|nr:hypothetical protein [Vibrio japonicus]UUM32478.1 hypothetical protein NP165_19605 [Vibrio japonicus]
MIEQKYKQDGLLSETRSNSLFPKLADLVLVFFPSPGVFVKDSLKVPDTFTVETAIYYEANGEPFDDMYVFLPAVLQRQYDSGQSGSGVVYEKNTLKLEPELVQALVEQSPSTIEHRSN